MYQVSVEFWYIGLFCILSPPLLLLSYFLSLFPSFFSPFSFPSRSHLATQTFLSKSVYQRADSFLFSGKHLATHTFSAKTLYQDQTRRHRDLNRPSERGKSLVEFEMARGRDPETRLRIMIFYYLCGRFLKTVVV